MPAASPRRWPPRARCQCGNTRCSRARMANVRSARARRSVCWPMRRCGSSRISSRSRCCRTSRAGCSIATPALTSLSHAQSLSASGRVRLVRRPRSAYIGLMSKEQVKAVLDRVLTWPAERQEDAAKLLMLMESQDESIYRLTDEQVDEVRRRRADKNAPKLTLDEFKERLSRRLGE